MLFRTGVEDGSYAAKSVFATPVCAGMITVPLGPTVFEQGVDDRIGPADDVSERAERRMHDDQMALAQPDFAQAPLDIILVHAGRHCKP